MIGENRRGRTEILERHRVSTLDAEHSVTDTVAALTIKRPSVRVLSPARTPCHQTHTSVLPDLYVPLLQYFAVHC